MCVCVCVCVYVCVCVCVCVWCWLRLSQGLRVIKVAISSNTKARVAVLETILGISTEGEQLFVCDRLDALSTETLVVKNELSGQRDVVLIRVEELATALDVHSSAARETQSQLETKISLLKRAICDLPRKGKVATKVKVFELKHFNGVRSAKDLENFL